MYAVVYTFSDAERDVRTGDRTGRHNDGAGLNRLQRSDQHRRVSPAVARLHATHTARPNDRKRGGGARARAVRNGLVRGTAAAAQRSAEPAPEAVRGHTHGRGAAEAENDGGPKRDRTRATTPSRARCHAAAAQWAVGPVVVVSGQNERITQFFVRSKEGFGFGSVESRGGAGGAGVCGEAEADVCDAKSGSGAGAELTEVTE